MNSTYVRSLVLPGALVLVALENILNNITMQIITKCIFQLTTINADCTTDAQNYNTQRQRKGRSSLAAVNRNQQTVINRSLIAFEFSMQFGRLIPNSYLNS